MIYLKSSDEKNVFAFTRSSEKDKVVAVFNLSSKPVEVKLIEDSLPGSYKNYFTGKLESFSTVASFELNPWEYRVYTK
ncbi:MAG: alpha-glucosidase C-terminal domain-containing protein [Ignavibacteriaceae bacterium]|jgi:hypothetical protein|nr:alpha-glucosidase C-terminal domain-containing protein [Ignavibacteriaceae bacterium]